jgi:hypothetical protein
MRLFKRKKRITVTDKDLAALRYAYNRLFYTYGEAEYLGYMIDLKNLEERIRGKV